MDKKNFSFSNRYLIIFLTGLLFNNVSFSSDQRLPDTISQVKNSIVAVGTYMPTRSPRASFRGTGFAIGDGSFIITNAHVLPKSLNLEKLEKLAIFIRKDGVTKMANVEKFAIDKDHDIAILKLLKGRIPALKLGDVDLVREGQEFAFTGYPIGMVLGLFPVTHKGIVSAITPLAIPMLKSRQLNTKIMKHLRKPYKVFQLDATAYPGNSGSPLYRTDNGQVVGVINKVFVKESKETVLSNPSGITYAIPIKHVRQLLDKKKL